ncbi:hypothetical protein MJ561_05350 [Klebsiella pneumoniae]|nr:hypothetical protein MJ561_05350 [Klebsiella pneumoniae]
MLQTLDSRCGRAPGSDGLPAPGIHLLTMRRKISRTGGSAFSMFAAMLESLKYEVIGTTGKIQCGCRKKSRAMEQQRREGPSAWRRCSSSAIRR